MSIFIVVADHWFKDSPIWILSTVALFVFGFSSAFFTGRLNGVDLDVGAFWNKKLRRLGVRYWLILSVLTMLLIVQGRDILHWHTIVHFIGLSGVLNLFGPSMSALGAGLWFFTLLLFFYAAYPLLARRLIASPRTTVTMAIATIALLALDHTVKFGFSLWLTMLGFLIGTYVGVNRLRTNVALLNGALIALPLSIAVLNMFFGFRALNGILLFACSLAISLRLTHPGLRLASLRFLVPLEACLLEIYLIHSYLFVHPSGNPIIDFLLSLVVIVAAAIVLNRAGNYLVARIFKNKPDKLVTAAVAQEGDGHLERSA
ncbi:acyltransferase family protein [Massilia litorea]|uniref:Acyltransferase 3 domain-containing protein n=1 Tax=Massilia litorea TaxID=2769491 RepID=A0A7L9UA19_9BURK|nr:acyltransferase family protein [Massilia litorea]QOL50936.1 hypothetical protein LPB04_06525 [Massilia litorea]